MFPVIYQKLYTLSLIKAYWLILVLVLSGCVMMTSPPNPLKIKQKLLLTDNLFVTHDGAALPVRRWIPKTAPKAILIALHGFNDYANFFDAPGNFFSQHNVLCFAYDQRGFGSAPKRGRWGGMTNYIQDLHDFVGLIKQQHPLQPIYLLGESMGGAVLIAAMREKQKSEVDGVILVAPALWARQTMPWYQTGLLWALAHTLPWLTLSGDGIGVQASDNIEMLKALGRDPQIIKKTRVEAIQGLTDLMDVAFASAHRLTGRALVLYGEKDEVIPKMPTYDFLLRLLSQAGEHKTAAIYPEGYHMLLRDLKAKIVWNDILLWITNKGGLVSGADRRAKEILDKL
jgi:acylglycerol lipase